MPCKMGTCLAFISPKQRASVDGGGGGGGGSSGSAGGTVDSLHRYQSPLDIGDICHLHRDSLCKGGSRGGGGGGQVGGGILHMLTNTDSRHYHHHQQQQQQQKRRNRNKNSKKHRSSSSIDHYSWAGDSTGDGGGGNGLELARFEVKAFELLGSAESFGTTTTTNSSMDNDDGEICSQKSVRLDPAHIPHASSSSSSSSGHHQYQHEEGRSCEDDNNNDNDNDRLPIIEEGKSRFLALLKEYYLISDVKNGCRLSDNKNDRRSPDHDDDELQCKCEPCSSSVFVNSSAAGTGRSKRPINCERGSSRDGGRAVHEQPYADGGSELLSRMNSASDSNGNSSDEASRSSSQQRPDRHRASRSDSSDLKDLVNTAFKDGRTLLHNAAHRGDLKTAAWLLRCGARVNARDHAKRTPLHEVADRGHVPLARLLLENGAKVNARDKWRATPLHQAVAWKQARMVRLLLLQHDARATGGTLLQDAINMDQKEDVIVKLIQRGADVNATDMTGQTPMHMAVKRGRAGIVQLLLEAGANVNKVSRGVMDFNYPAVLTNARRQLAAIGLEERLQDGWSPLRMAQKYRHFDLVVWLVNCGANIVLCDGTGRFPHHKATTQRDCPSLHHIAAHAHCPLDLRDADGNSALKLSFEAHAKSMVDANPQCGCCSNQRTMMTAGGTIGAKPAPSCDEYANTSILLLQHGADISGLVIHGYDLLYHLSSSKFSYDVRLLQAVLNSGNDLRELLSCTQPCLNALQRQQRLDMYEYLAYFAVSPRSLRDQCRLTLRSQLRRCRRGRSIWTAVTALPLPHALMDFLLLQQLQGATLTRHFENHSLPGYPTPPPPQRFGHTFNGDFMTLTDSDKSLEFSHSYC